MRKIRRLFVIALLFIYCNFTYFCVSMPAPGFTWLLAGILGTIFYLCCHIIPGRMCGKTVRGLSPRLQALIGGVELIMAVAVCSIGEVIFYIVIWKNTAAGLLVLNGILAMLFLFFLMGNGIVRVFLTTKQIGILSKIIYLLLWWVPILNLFFVARMWRAARFEYEVERNLLEMNAARQENTVCHTRYPIIMVHG
ncbi:MAG: hypothetical protein EOM18_14310, partial [Clostridia bacterium]|nr:hypothetical protein [Clostridia bacterium]